jgi:hypothetical protein
VATFKYCGVLDETVLKGAFSPYIGLSEEPMKNWAMIGFLAGATTMLVACGDDNKDSRLSDADVLCLKVQRQGGSCNPNQTNTSGSTNTVTQTQTSTVTVTRTN